MPLAYMNAYPPTMSCREASLTCRSRWSEGAATLTTQMSKPAMNIASSTTGSISQRRDAVSIRKLLHTRVFDDNRSSMYLELYDGCRTHRNLDLCCGGDGGRRRARRGRHAATHG